MKLAITDILSDPVRHVFENLQAAITACWEVEHTPEGQHKSITATGNVIATGLGTFSGQSRARLRKATAGNQSLTDSTETRITWDAPLNPKGYLEYDTDSIFSRDGLFTDIRPKYKGLYLVTAGLRFDSASTLGARYVGIEWGLDNMGWGPILSGMAAGVVPGTQTTCVIPYDPDDSQLNLPFRVLGLQTSGGALNVIGNAIGTFFQVTKLS